MQCRNYFTFVQLFAAVHAWGQSSHATKHDDPESLVSQFYDLAQKGTKPDSSLVSSLNTSLEKKGSSFGPQEIANLLWSVAKTGTKLDPKILATVFGLISAKAGSGPKQKVFPEKVF